MKMDLAIDRNSNDENQGSYVLPSPPDINSPLPPTFLSPTHVAENPPTSTTSKKRGRPRIHSFGWRSTQNINKRQLKLRFDVSVKWNKIKKKWAQVNSLASADANNSNFALALLSHCENIWNFGSVCENDVDTV